MLQRTEGGTGSSDFNTGASTLVEGQQAHSVLQKISIWIQKCNYRQLLETHAACYTADTHHPLKYTEVNKIKVEKYHGCIQEKAVYTSAL